MQKLPISVIAVSGVAVLCSAGCRSSQAPADAPHAISSAPLLSIPDAELPDFYLAADGTAYLTYVTTDARDLTTLHRRALRPGATPEALLADSTWFVNWADVPRMAALGSGAVGHVPEATGSGTYDYRVGYFTADAGAASTPQSLHDDSGLSEHGFVSYAPMAPDSTLAVWLDGGAAAFAKTQHDGSPHASHGHGTADAPMQLHARAIYPGGDLGPERTLDASVCDCCPTDVAVGSRGPVVVYRDRVVDGELRDIYRALPGTDLPPAPIHVDGYRVAGCPVNGPAVAARGDTVAVAYFTAAAESPRVRLAWSTDGGVNFGPPVTVDADAPLGRVDLALTDDGRAALVYLARDVGGSAPLIFATAAPGEAPVTTALDTVGAARASGIPRIVQSSGGLLVAYRMGTSGAGSSGGGSPGVRVRSIGLE